MNNEILVFERTFKYKLIYIFRINDKSHEGVLKIGEATVEWDEAIDELYENSEILNKSAKARIDSYTSTAGIVYQLLHTELAVDKHNSSFSDHKVHDVLTNSGIEKKHFDTNRKQDEWFHVDLETAKNAIKAYKDGKQSLTRDKITEKMSPIVFRPEQEEAIKSTIKQFEKSDRMLWNAKMRFGKTLSALEVIKQKQYKKTIIITHRPVVEDGWFKDFKKIFYDTNNYRVGAKNKESISSLEKSHDNYIYFASVQDLRGSSVVGGNFDKNHKIFDIDWDFVIIDEAHEGTKTDLGKLVLEEIIKADNLHKTKVLHLSGTPFNLISEFDEKEVYTWDYVMEQTAKQNWTKNHYLDWNPYAELPKLNIYTYDLNKLITGFQGIEDKAFNFREFFRTWTGDVELDKKRIPEVSKIGDFIYEEEVSKFLDLITKSGDSSNYPFSTEEYRELFKHTLWMVPGVKEAKALSKVMKRHPVFGIFKIVNVAGDGDEEVQSNDALRMVEGAINKNPYTITISCGKLTTGVSIPAWTAVMMLSGSYSTTASNYLQTIFRVQTPANIDGKIKENCYVFDFAPDRTLKIAAEASNLSTKAGSINDKKQIGAFLNFCPIISVEGSQMKPYNVDGLLGQLKKVYAERVVNNGFDDAKLYNDNLLKLDGLELEEFQNLQKIMGSTKQSKRINEIDINKQGLTNEEFEEQKKLNEKPKRELSDEEKSRLEELNEKRKQKNTAVSILRGISIRIPLMIYGADIPFDNDVTVENFTSIVDDMSWKEFMPKGITKDIFNDFSKYYDREIFIEAGRKIRLQLKAADELPITERVIRIAEIFSTFKNPDKETVLTPWRVVNMHLGDCLGGYNFYDENYKNTIDEPRLKIYPGITSETLSNSEAKILEINSKTGLYPLYVTYSIYRQKYLNINHKILESEKQNVSEELWKETLSNNIFVITKTKMAKLITQRTISGFKLEECNIKYYENLIEDFKNNSNKFIKIINNPKTWKKDGERMKFDAIVGNPPYQEILANYENTVSQANPIYNLFFENAISLKPNYISLITPSLWMTAGTGLTDFRKKILSSKNIVVMHDYEDSKQIFDNVAIAGGISYSLYKDTHNNDMKYFFHHSDGTIENANRNLDEFGDEIFIRDNIAAKILNKIGVFNSEFNSFQDIVSTNSPFTKGKAGLYKNVIVHKKENENFIKIYKNPKTKNGKFGFINTEDIVAKKEWIDKHKVFVSKAGEISARFNGLPFYGEPGSICTETYLLVGPFSNEEECRNCIKYMNTNFYKFLVSQIKKTQNAARGVYKYVPLLDFVKGSEIDFNNDLNEINRSLYKYYNITDLEINYIEKKTN